MTLQNQACKARLQNHSERFQSPHISKTIFLHEEDGGFARREASCSLNRHLPSLATTSGIRSDPYKQPRLK